MAGFIVIQILADEFRGAGSEGEEFLTRLGTDLLQRVCGAGKVHDCKSVPSGDDLVVEIGTGAFSIAVGFKFSARGGEDGVDLRYGERGELFRELLGSGGNGEHVLVDEFIVSVVFQIDVAGAVDVVVFCDYGGVGFAEDYVEFVA